MNILEKIEALKNFKGIIIDFGCGNNKLRLEGCKVIGLDYLPGKDVDIISRFDDCLTLPFKSNSFDGAYLSHVLEHVKEPVLLLEEIRRICKKGALVVIRVPHYSNPRTYEIYHKSHFSYYSLDPLTTDKSRSAEVRPFFEITKRTFVMLPIKRVFIPWQKIGEVIANCFPNLYEALFHVLWPAYEIVFELKVRK